MSSYFLIFIIENVVLFIMALTFNNISYFIYILCVTPFINMLTKFTKLSINTAFYTISFFIRLSKKKKDLFSRMPGFLKGPLHTYTLLTLNTVITLLLYLFTQAHPDNVITDFTTKIYIYSIFSYLELLVSFLNHPSIIPLLLVSSSVMCFFFARQLSPFFVLCVNISNLIYAFIVVLFIYYIYSSRGHYSYTMRSGQFDDDLLSAKSWGILPFEFELYFDAITFSMLFLVIIISFCVNWFSYNYMLTDPHQTRFFSCLAIFTFFMLLLVCSNNLLQFFFAWEGVGICSYLLIGFWFTRIQAIKAAIKAVLINKIGDVFLLFAVSLCHIFFGIKTFTSLKSFSIITTEVLTPLTLNDTLPVFLTTTGFYTFVIGSCFLVAGVAKSAQLGLHTWLPDAMEGPTPVSALLHAATMVTAGVYLLIRVSPLMNIVSNVQNFNAVLGALTAVCAGLIALFQTDLKKIIAYSTCSQLGYMFFACGLSLNTFALFHLISHGFFKALLFLLAGVMIHLYKNDQSTTKLAVFEPVKFATYISLLYYIGTASLIALPFFSGFYSKEAIINNSAGLYHAMQWSIGLLAYHCGITAALLTLLYSAGSFFDLFQQIPKTNRSNKVHWSFAWSSKYTTYLLTLFSTFFGLYLGDTAYSFYHTYFDPYIQIYGIYNVGAWYTQAMLNPALLDAMPTVAELWPLFVCLFLMCFPYGLLTELTKKNPWIIDEMAKPMVYLIWKYFEVYGALLRFFLINKFWFDLLINKTSRRALFYGWLMFKLSEKGGLEKFLFRALMFFDFLKVQFRKLDFNTIMYTFIGALVIVLCIIFFF